MERFLFGKKGHLAKTEQEVLVVAVEAKGPRPPLLTQSLHRLAGPFNQRLWTERGRTFSLGRSPYLGQGGRLGFVSRDSCPDA